MSDIDLIFPGNGISVERWQAQCRFMQAGWFAICISGQLVVHIANMGFEAFHVRNRRLHAEGLCLQAFQLLFLRLAVLGIYLASTQNNYFRKGSSPSGQVSTNVRNDRFDLIPELFDKPREEYV